ASLSCQAEDGIRDKLVTGVQTCALPISYWPPDAHGACLTRHRHAERGGGSADNRASKEFASLHGASLLACRTARIIESADRSIRSEERRVGKASRHQGLR